MNFLEITDVFKEVVQQYIDDLTVAVNYINANDLYKKLKTDSINCDARDFVPMVAMMGRERGSTMLKRILVSVAPSTLAASSRLSGRPRKKLIIRITL